ncbi:MAG: DNA polymerase [Candidatus Pacebacteria bacterium]|jgi:DNA polymerase-1|nr:hypothetical protein [bacterium]MDP6527978.1 DNA polymerase [Candidatus Paceibacterota bacterium]MDP6659764.1 DNA polymerase [Candidatus Paceibacterota bacterium]|tara:strand:+ start:5601 stop:7988 length:2388 start_codon:yes stop_codon:yes gene_type:complete
MPKADKKNEKKRLVLLDAHAILHRAYHALPDFSSRGGEPTGGLYGLVSMLLKIVSELKPDYIVACYDLPEPTYRHVAYDGYKAGRKKADDELISQIERSRDVFEAFHIPIYEKAGFEADDVLGAIAEQTKKNKNLEVVIASGDMDTLQLVEGRRVQVYTLRKGITDTVMYDEKAVNERFGFGPELLPDFKGLRGDPSDNIIGIAGIGEKTATTLIDSFGSIEEMYKTLKKSPDKFESAGTKPRIVNLLTEGEEEALFSKELATIRRDVPIKFSLPKTSWRDGIDVNKIFKLFDELSFRTLSERVKKFFDVENQGEEKKPKEEINDEELSETSVALWLLRSDMTNPTLEEILQFTETDSFKEAKEKIFNEIEKEKLNSVFKDVEKPIIKIVAEMKKVGILIDQKYLEKLSKNYHKELSKLESKIYKEAGEEFNINSPKQLSEILYEKLGLVPKNQKKTSTGQKSTKESELEKLRGEHEIIEAILSYRELQKLLSTYIDNIPQMISHDGRLHADFLQSGTTTGRMASQNPNLQNIPIKTELGRNIRNAFVASDGYDLVAFDYSQIELRVAAFLSGDEKLLDVFIKGGDVHNAVASEVFNVPPEMVDSEMRRQAKVINFGIIYGMGVNALRQNLGGETTRADAQKFYNEYFKNFSGLSHYLDRVKAGAARLGYTETHFGRRRYFEGINSSIPFIRASAERMAINAPIQGTQADIIKIAMSRIDEYLSKNNLKEDARLLLQVHDELVYEIKSEKVEKASKEIKKIMESVLPQEETKGISFVTDVLYGKNWGEMESLDNL